MTYSIVISLSQKRLFLYRNGTIFKQYPIAIGKKQTPTPTGQFKIINKAPNPGGVYGSFWMGLNKPGYGIHGTNNPSSIGKAISNGCVRMYNKDVVELSGLVSVGTAVTIKN